MGKKEMEAVMSIRRGFMSSKSDKAVETLLLLFTKTKSNDDVVNYILSKS